MSGLVFQVRLGVLPALADAGLAVGEERAALGDQFHLDADVNNGSGARNAFAEHDVELGLAEGRGDFVLDHFDFDPVADHVRALLQRLNAPDIQHHRGVELQGASAGGCFRVAEHDADFFADLVDKDRRRVGLGDGAVQLPHGLRHQAGLQAHVAVAHLAFNLGFRHQRGD